MYFQASSNFLNDEEQIKAQMATLGQELKNLPSELQEYRVNAVEGSTHTIDPNQKGRQNARRFSKYCRTNGHTPNWCHTEIHDEELERIENERTAEKKVTFTQDYNKKRGPGHESEQWVRGQKLQRRNENYTNDGPTRNSPTAYQNFARRPKFAYRNNNPNNGGPYDQRSYQFFKKGDGNRSRNGFFNNQNGNWRNNGNLSRSPSTQRKILTKKFIPPNEK